MYGDASLGERARTLRTNAGQSSAECTALAEAAASRAASGERDAIGDDGDGTIGIVPRSTACLFVRGRSDPVLEPQYVDAYYAFLKARTTSSVEWHLFEKAQHAMAVVEAPAQYKGLHVERLLRQVPGFVR